MTYVSDPESFPLLRVEGVLVEGHWWNSIQHMNSQLTPRTSKVHNKMSIDVSRSWAVFEGPEKRWYQGEPSWREMWQRLDCLCKGLLFLQFIKLYFTEISPSCHLYGICNPSSKLSLRGDLCSLFPSLHAAAGMLSHARCCWKTSTLIFQTYKIPFHSLALNPCDKMASALCYSWNCH